MHTLRNIYQPLVWIGNFLQPFLLLILRVYWGWWLFQTGLGKFHNIERVTHFFSGLGIPFPSFTVYLVATVELVCGLFLLFGFLSRLSALLVTIVMLTAYATAHTEALLKFFTNSSLFAEQAPYPFLLTALIVFCFGPGAFSLDWLGRRYILDEK